MPGKPRQSKLAPFEAEIAALLEQGKSYRAVAELLNQRHGLGVSHNAVYSYVSATSRRHRFHRSFLAGLDPDLRDALMRQLVAEWTHDSTAIEGNTLTLGETVEVLQLGLTIGGKSLKDHEEVYGHARAIDLLRELTEVKRIDTQILFDLHRAVMHRATNDVMNPVGAWKRDYNGTTGVAAGKPVYMEYASPSDTPPLMDRWLAGFNRRLDGAAQRAAALEAYTWSHTAFVRIHPFFDGNGRMARLIANLPLLRGGHPPLTVAAEDRVSYIRLLWDYQWQAGRIEPAAELVPEHPALDETRRFFGAQWLRVVSLVDSVRARQRERDSRST